MSSGGHCLDPKPRQFYVKSSSKLSSALRQNGSREKSEKIAKHVHDNLLDVGSNFSGPFGVRPVLYCDYIASGKPVRFIEDFIRSKVLPYYANTHTTTTITALQTTLFRDEARDIFRNAVNAGEEDAVIFTGFGCTGAVHKLVNVVKPLMSGRKVIVMASLMEHHSNLLPWRDSGAEVRLVGETSQGSVDLEDLESNLVGAAESDGVLVIGCFSAASNVTGVLNDDLAITALLHKYGALSFWDYATAAPYANIDMNPYVAGDQLKLLRKDAVYFSMHKFVGGPQCPGVLIAKKKLFANQTIPNGGGGGSVFFVTKEDHRYLQDLENREEGGTPAVVETIRAGLAMQLKQAVGAQFIMDKEMAIVKKIEAFAERTPNFRLLGNKNNFKLPIMSFVIRSPVTGLFLHHNFVCALLNDLFGIQARGGCACAGPYAQDLLGIDLDLARDFEVVLAEDSRLDRDHLRRKHQECSSYEILRPGFSRLNFTWFQEPDEIDYVFQALELISEHGWQLLPQYRFHNETGEWKHYSDLEYKERKWLGNVFYNEEGEFCFNEKSSQAASLSHLEQKLNWKPLLVQAKEILKNAKTDAKKRQLPDHTGAFADEQVKKLRWFLLPSEARDNLLGSDWKSHSSVFNLKQYPDVTSRSPDIANSYFGTTVATTEKLESILTSCSRKFVLPELTNKLNGPIEIKRTKFQETTVVISSELKEEIEKENIDSCENGLCLPSGPRSKKDIALATKAKWHAPTRDIFKPFLEAVELFQMIKNDDRVLICLSGGKDSLTLLHTMKQYQYYAKEQGISFDLGAVTVDPLSSAYDPRPLIPYLNELGVPFLYEEQAIMAQALEANCSSICAFCSRMKRGRIYAAARRENYNVLAMGQHLDDCAESFLMSVFHNGRLRTMKANYSVKEGDLRVIRPLVFVREKQLRDFAEKKRLPVIPENCPACFENPKERHRTKQLLAQQELLFPRLYWSLKSALIPVMNVRRTGVESVLFGRALDLKEDDISAQDVDDDLEI